MALQYATRGVRRPFRRFRPATWLRRSVRVAYRVFYSPATRLGVALGYATRGVPPSSSTPRVCLRLPLRTFSSRLGASSGAFLGPPIGSPPGSVSVPHRRVALAVRSPPQVPFFPGVFQFWCACASSSSALRLLRPWSLRARWRRRLAWDPAWSAAELACRLASPDQLLGKELDRARPCCVLPATAVAGRTGPAAVARRAVPLNVSFA